MRSFVARLPLRRGVVLAAGLLAATSAATAQSRVGATQKVGTAEITPYAGVIMFGSYLKGPLGTSVRSKPAPIGGAQVSVPLGGGLAVTGNVGYSRSDLEVGLPILGGLDVGSSSSLLYDAGLELRVPTAAGSNVAPFLQAGAGAITTKLSGGPVTTSSTNAAFNVGGGIDLSFGRSTALRLQARDYIGRYKSESVAGLEARGDVTHNVAVSAGLRLTF